MKPFDKILKISEQVSWEIDSLLSIESKLDFSRFYLPFDPEKEWGLSKEAAIDLNHLMSASYLNLFAFVEEFIIVQAVQLVNEQLFSDTKKLRAVLRFAEEEVKHQELFYNYLELFQEQFKINPNFVKNSKEVTDYILSHSVKTVLLLTLHLEIITQDHYLQFKRKDLDCDDMFFNLLKHHWIEESQHAKIDKIVLYEKCENQTPEMLNIVFDHYIDILKEFSKVMYQQAKLNIEDLTVMHDISKENELDLIKKLHFFYVNMFITAGLKHNEMNDVALELFHKDLSSYAANFDEEAIVDYAS